MLKVSRVAKRKSVIRYLHFRCQHTELQACHDKMDLLTDIVANYGDKMNTLSSKVDALEAQNQKSEIIVFGLNLSAPALYWTLKLASLLGIAQGFVA